MSALSFDLLTMGRSSIDLYAQDVGAAFEDIRGFAAYVGGSPLNIAVGARRLGLRTALLTAVGADKVGDFIVAINAVRRESRHHPLRTPLRRLSSFVRSNKPRQKGNGGKPQGRRRPKRSF